MASESSAASFWAALGLLVLYIVVWVICLNGWRVARNRYGHVAVPSKLQSLPAESVPGVTIIRPLCGLDNNMYNTLESVMVLDYPKYEVIFALQDENDEALPVVNMVMGKHPKVPASVIINSEKIGVNPKINNLMEPFRRATYDLVWVLDGTVAITPGTLGRMVDAFIGHTKDVECSTPIIDADRQPPMRGEVGLVHQVPMAVVYQRTWGSLIEQAYLNTTHAKMYLSINSVAVDSCVVGKSNMYSRSNINSLSTPSPTLRKEVDPPRGLAAFSSYLAEDNMIGLGVWHELGLKHAMTSDVALDFLGALSVRAYIDRRARWIRVRKMMSLAATLLEPFTEGILSGVYGGWALHRLFGVPRLAFWLLHMAVWLSVDLSVRRNLATNVRGIGPPTDTIPFCIAWAARECLALPIWLYAMLGSVVTWRGHRYRILASGEAKRVD